MKKRIGVIVMIVVVLLFSFTAAQAATREFTVKVTSNTGRAVPVVITMDQLRDAIGVEFAANWDSIRVLDARGNTLPYQIDDIDLSGSLSGADELSFLAGSDVTVRLNDDDEALRARYANAFNVTLNQNQSGLIESVDGQIKAELSPFGTVNLVKALNKEETFVQNVGALRYAGWPDSRWYTEKNLGDHKEYTTFEEPLRLVKQQISAATPVRVAIVNKVASEVIPGLRGTIVVSIWASGEVRSDYHLCMAAYTDLSKLMPFVSGVLAGANDARHALPAFRWLDWADELGLSPTAYYAERDATLNLDGRDYIAFTDNRGPKPLFWGASYIFTSPERWRTDYSPAKKLGLAEALPVLPTLADDLEEKLRGVNWHLEGEWRTGYFRWIADEIVAFRKKNQIAVDLTTDMVAGDWVLHAQPGDTFDFHFYYIPYEADDLAAGIRYIENRYADLTSVGIGK